ncbi:MAG TPA: hypothetical protein VLB46_20635 [Pyrinomonadaceae bacterium]|nr:hypothetical protein [Pyrinomonadaceae bacterium]
MSLTRTRSQLLNCFLTVVILISGLSTANSQTRRRPAPRRGTVTRPAPPAPPVTPVTPAEDESPLDPAIVAESQRAQQRELEEQSKLESALIARIEPSVTAADDLWRGYRQTFPFHSQVIALSEPATDGSRTLIVSEPPPHVTLGEILTSVGSDLLLNHQVKKQHIGYDGWVKDVVIAIKGNDEAALQSMLSRLNQRLFFTSYKSYTLRLPVRLRTTALDLNLAVTPTELNQWVVNEAEQFFPVEGGAAETFASLSRQLSSGVYVSHKRGLIAWWIPKKRNLHECRVSARQFALDADLVIGALANQSGVLVLGREREVPVDILPPLRFETLALLADVQEGQYGHLAQSYERNHDFAGRIAERKDWAPILLSPQLRDTEYGSLLNITDQMLKGWSNSGDTRYENFPYPAPEKYPFSKPVSDVLGVGSTTEALTYNWNTKGVGFTVNVGPLTFLALNRTGALPVSYIPDGVDRAANNVVVAEDTGYNYFSGLGDPNLARVVQYAALYQIFSAFDVAHSTKPLPADSYPDQLLESMTAELKNSLQTASESELENVAAQLVPALRRDLDEEINNSWKEHLEDLKKDINKALVSKGYPPGTKEYADKFDYLLSEVRKEHEESVKKQIAGTVKEHLLSAKLDRPYKDAADRATRGETLSRYAHFKQMPQRYAATIGERAKGWIHTPVVVISWNSQAAFIGGHNLDARVSRIKVDERLAPGEVSVDETGALVINSADVPRVREWARNVERNNLYRNLATAYETKDPVKINAVRAEIKRALNSADVVAARPREGALKLSGTVPPSKPPVNKPPISNGEPGGVGGAGWGGNGRSALPVAADLRRSSSVVRIKASANRFDVEYGGEAGSNAFVLNGLTHEDAVDAAAVLVSRRAKAGEVIVVDIEGLPEHRAYATRRSIEIQAAAKGTPVEVIARMSDGQVSLEVLASKYNFSQARLNVGEIKTLETGELQNSIDLTVPTMDNSGQSVSFTAEMTFNRSTPREVIAAATSRITMRLQEMAKAWGRVTSTASQKSTVAKYNSELARSLKKFRTRTKLNFDVKSKLNFSGSPQGIGDIYIGE